MDEATLPGPSMWDLWDSMEDQMPAGHLNINVHRSLHPAEARRRLEESLKQGFVPTRMLYETPRQVRRWQELVVAYSPSVKVDDGAVVYEEIHRAAVEPAGGESVQLVGIACGDGRKEASLTDLLIGSGRGPISWVPVEGSLPLVQLAASRVAAGSAVSNGGAVLADLEAVGDELPDLIRRPEGCIRMVTLYGVLPGMDADRALSVACSLLERGDLLLVSSNSEPGEGDDSSRVVDQYDNDLTRGWIGLMLEDLGMTELVNDIDFGIGSESMGTRTIEATVARPGQERLTVFRSSRQSADALRNLLEGRNLEVDALVTSASGEETVALARAA